MNSILSKSSTAMSNQRKFELLKAVFSEVMEAVRLHPDLNANDLALLTLRRPDGTDMTSVQAISSLATSRSPSDKGLKGQKASLNASSSHAPNVAVMPKTSPSAIEEWDFVDSDPAATAEMQIGGIEEDEETQPKPKAGGDGPTESDIIVTDFAERGSNETGPKVQTIMSQALETSLARFDIQKCVILGTLVSMLVEMMQLLQQQQNKYPAGQDPFEIATRIYERCTDGNDDDNNNNDASSILYEAALAISLLVPFTTKVSSNASGSGNEPTFLGHRVGVDHQPGEPQEPGDLVADAEVALPATAARIEFLVLDSKDGWDRLYIGSVFNDLPQGVGCTFWAKKKDKLSLSVIRTACGTWNKGLLNGTGWEMYESGSRYTGNFQGGIRQGAGMMTYRDGLVRKGIFDTWDHRL
ncbi:unnamed protein product [Cylindrotheca closterium]|uniref:Uncharacterized protein n=1 Tax=Cylindrotheca closterium TaxID=2856 RepID=A0AAD2CBJ5_9STRA|nr:unnamed protein product [Cylindrotheca closterium]